MRSSDPVSLRILQKCICGCFGNVWIFQKFIGGFSCQVDAGLSFGTRVAVLRIGRGAFTAYQGIPFNEGAR